MGNDGLTASKRMADQVEVGNAKERVNSGGLVSLTGYPTADGSQGSRQIRRWPEKEFRTPLSCPLREIIIARLDFVTDSLDTEDQPSLVCLDEPVPETGTEVKTVVQVFCSDEYVCIQKIRHYKLTCRLAAKPRNVDAFLIPSRRNDSENEVRPPNVLMVTATPNRWPTRVLRVGWKVPPPVLGIRRKRSSSRR